MRSRLGNPWLWAGLAFFAVALLLPPGATVDRFLPAKHAYYRDSLSKGLWLWKGVLFVDGILLLLIPYVKRVFPGRRPLPPLRSFQARELALVGAISLFAALLRLYHITDGFSYDEHIIHSVVKNGPLFILMRAEVWRTLYMFLAKAAYGVVGAPEVAERLPALLSGIASIPALYWLVRGSLGERQGYVASLLLAISTFHIWYSQSGTPYTMTLLFTIISLAIYLKCTQVDCVGPWFRWGVVTLLLFCSQVFSTFFVLAGQAMYTAWLVWRRDAEPTVLGRMAAAIVYAAAVFATCVAPAAFISWGVLQRQQAWTVPVRETLTMLARWLLQTYSSWPGQLLLALCTAVGLAVVWRGDRRMALYLSLPTVVLVGVFLATVVATGSLGAVGVRHCIFVLIPVCAFAGAAVVAAVDWVTLTRAGWRKAVAAVAVVIGTAASTAVPAWSSLKEYFARERRPFRPTGDYVTKRMVQGESAVYGGFGYGFGYEPFRFYLPSLEYAAEYEDLVARLDDTKPFWLIHYQAAYLNRMPTDVRERLERQGRLELHYVGRQESPEDDWESFVWYVKP